MRLSLIEITDALTATMVPVPADSCDVCPICRSWRAEGEHLCNNCQQATEELAAPCRRVIPICLYSKPSDMRDRLKFYKDGDEAQRARYAPEIAAILDRFFLEYGGQLAAVTGGWDVACVVPSESRRPPHPLEVALAELPTKHVPHRERLLERNPGEPVGHRTVNDLAFRPLTDVAGRQVLVLDDVYTTGARAQSAASALSRAGATVAAIVVVARRVNPDYKPGVQAMWNRQAPIPFSFKAAPWWAGRD